MKWRWRFKDTGTLIGATEEALDPAAVDQWFKTHGSAAELAGLLEDAVDQGIASLAGRTPLTDLSGDLAMAYLERISRPLSRLQTPEAVWIVTRGYEAHRVLEWRGREFGVDEMPVITSLPDLAGREAVRDIQLKLVRSSGKSFAGLCALDPQILEGLILLTMTAVHEQVAARDGDSEEGAVYVSADVVRGLVRYGWLLRQVDLYYAQFN